MEVDITSGECAYVIFNEVDIAHLGYKDDAGAVSSNLFLFSFLSVPLNVVLLSSVDALLVLSLIVPEQPMSWLWSW